MTSKTYDYMIIDIGAGADASHFMSAANKKLQYW